jgi:hypothetical protein
VRLRKGWCHQVSACIEQLLSTVDVNSTCCSGNTAALLPVPACAVCLTLLWTGASSSSWAGRQQWCTTPLIPGFSSMMTCSRPCLAWR